MGALAIGVMTRNRPPVGTLWVCPLPRSRLVDDQLAILTTSHRQIPGDANIDAEERDIRQLSD